MKVAKFCIPALPQSRRARIILAAAAVLVVLGVVAIIAVLRLSTTAETAKTPVKAKLVCSDDVVNRANPAINAGDLTVLQPIAGEVAALKDFDHDPSCLYIVLRYAIATGDTAKARTYLETLREVYGQGVLYNKGFQPMVMTLDALQTAIGLKETANKRMLNQSSEDNLDAIDKQGSSQ